MGQGLRPWPFPLELGKQWSRDYPASPATSTLPDANLRYQEALGWRKRTKEDVASFFCRRSFS